MKYLKTILIVVAILAVGALGFLTYKYITNSRELAELKQTKTNVAKQIQKEATEIKRQVDSKGIESVLYDVTGNKHPLAAVQSNEATKGIIDTTAMALDVRTNQLKQIMVVNSTLVANNLQLKRQLDSNKVAFYTYSGQGLSMKFRPPNPLDANSVATADFTANVSIKATQYAKRAWFLGAKKSYLSITSDNPLYKINGVDFIDIEQKDPVFGLRIQASANYNPESGAMGVGPAARFDAGRFSFQGNYTYYPQSQRWRPSINANYDLIRF